RSRSPSPTASMPSIFMPSIRNHEYDLWRSSSGKNPPLWTRRTLLYWLLRLSTKLARRARPPLGVCQPQGLVFPLTSVVERMTSLSGWSSLGLPAAASVSQLITARIATASTRVARNFMRFSGGRQAQDPANQGEVYGPRARSVKKLARGRRASPASCPLADMERSSSSGRPASRGPDPALASEPVSAGSGARLHTRLLASFDSGTRYLRIWSPTGTRRPDRACTTRTSKP